MSLRQPLPWFLGTIVLWGMMHPLDASQPMPTDWAVVTELQAEDSSTSTHVAIFRGTQVYSGSLDREGETTVLDLATRRFEFLDPDRRLRTTLAGAEVYEAMLQIEERASRMNPLIRFAAAPSFIMEIDQVARQLSFRSDLLSYEVTGTSLDADRVHSYLDYADWSARLGALRPGGLPAVPRLYVNRELRMRQWVPLVVTRTIQWQGRTSIAKSRHTYHEAASAEHQQWVIRINELRDRCTRVDLAQFNQPSVENEEKTRR